MIRPYIEHCNYCIRKDIDSGLLDSSVWEEYYLAHDQGILENYSSANANYDNHNIFVFYACENCKEEQMKNYDPAIFNDWKEYESKVIESGERFEPDE